jgi:hypothetical protein
MQMRLQHLLQLLQSRFYLHFGDADADQAAARDGLKTLRMRVGCSGFGYNGNASGKDRLPLPYCF